MAEFKERTDNPLHRKFGVWSNTRYVLAKCRQYCPSVIPIAVMGVVCGSVLGYFWGIFGKYVIDLIQSGLSEEESVRALLRILAVGASWQQSCYSAIPIPTVRQGIVISSSVCG